MDDTFQADGLRISHPIHLTVDNSLNVHNIFDNITYNKGCSVVKMIASYVGEDAFLKGVSQYLKGNTYKNTTAKALWHSLGEASGKEVAAMADS